LLCITYAAVDRKSNAVVRSPFIDNLCSLFEDLKEESAASDVSPIDEVCTTYELENALCCGLGTQQPSTDGWRLEGLLQQLLEDDQLSTLGERVARAVNYENKAELDNDVDRKLFSGQITSSASRLSTFAACPYKHFATYVLELKKRDEFKLEPLDVGEFYHRVLDGFLKRAVAERLNFETVGPAMLIEILDQEIEKLCREDAFISKFAAHSPHNTFVINTATEYLQDCVVAVSQMIRAGSFRPAVSEVTFGKPISAGQRIGEFEITLKDGRRLSLNGRIDRVDVARINGRNVALVFDYKKRPETFSWAEFFHGLDMQLPIYILAVLESCDAHKIAADVAGAFYLPVEVSSEAISLDEIADGGVRFAHKAKGIFNGEYARHLDPAASRDSRFYNFYVKTDGDPYGRYNWLGALTPPDFEAFLSFCTRKITELAGQIVSGKITAAPYRLATKSPCGQCDYKPVCRFDWQINNYNLLAGVDKQQVLEEIRQQTADGNRHLTAVRGPDESKEN
jgi:ATP-dependent helicase/nuclease subunit B